jgi:hypothetical protein
MFGGVPPTFEQTSAPLKDPILAASLAQTSQYCPTIAPIQLLTTLVRFWWTLPSRSRPPDRHPRSQVSFIYLIYTPARLVVALGVWAGIAALLIPLANARSMGWLGDHAILFAAQPEWLDYIFPRARWPVGELYKLSIIVYLNLGSSSRKCHETPFLNPFVCPMALQTDTRPGCETM